MQEEFRDVIGYEGYYKISSFGRVMSVERRVYASGLPSGFSTIKEKELKQALNIKGYPIVYLSKEGKQKTVVVHRLVALAFIENPKNRPQVNHIDCNKLNNRVDNLEWVTNGENQIHAYANGLNKRSNKAGRPPKKVLMLDRSTKEVVREFECLADIRRYLGINTGNVRQVCLGKRNHAGGYLWVFAKGGDAL